MSLLQFIMFGDSEYQKSYQITTINGDLSPTALDQLQLFPGDSVAIKGTTSYMLYTGNGQGDGVEDVDLIFLATKDLTVDQDFTVGWVKYGSPGDATAVISPSATTWKDYQVFVRTMIYDTTDNIFKCWYVGDDRTGATKFTVGYATSTDAITWADHGSNPIYENFTDFDALGVVLFPVFKESNSLYHAFAQGAGRIGDTWGATHATSTDGINWTNQTTGILNSTDVRFISAMRKYGNVYYVYTISGRNTNYHPSLGGISTNISLYTTTDLINYTFVGVIRENIEPQEAGIGTTSFVAYSGKNYSIYSYAKNQTKNPFSGGEPYGAIKVTESNRNFTSIISDQTIYPSYLKRYYPCYQADESQTPTERIGGEASITTGTLSWTQLRYVDFTGSQLITYSEYVPADTTKFAVKARVLPQATLTRQIMRQSDGTDGWAMFLNAGKLQVDLYESTTLKKSYVTVDDVVKPAGVWDENDHTSVGFIFDSGALKLCFGSSADQTATKTVDLALTDIETGGNDVEIGAGSVTNEMRSFCIFDEITEDQWLNVIDL